MAPGLRHQPRTPTELGELGAKPLPVGKYGRELRQFHNDFLSIISRWTAAALLEDPKQRESQFQRFKAELSVFDALFKHHGPICRELAFNITSAMAKRKDVPALTLLAIYAESALGDSALVELKKLAYSPNAETANNAYFSTGRSCSPAVPSAQSAQ